MGSSSVGPLGGLTRHWINSRRHQRHQRDPVTDAVVDKVAREILSFVSSDQIQVDRVGYVAAYILGKLRDMFWVMDSRATQKYGGAINFSDESLSRHIDEYGGMVAMICEQCGTNLEMAKLALRDVVAAVVCDGNNPFSKEAVGGDDDLPPNFEGDDDSRASSSSSLGRRSYSEIKEPGNFSPARKKRSSRPCLYDYGEGDVIQEGVPKYVAVNAPADNFDAEEEGEVRCARWI